MSSHKNATPKQLYWFVVAAGVLSIAGCYIPKIEDRPPSYPEGSVGTVAGRVIDSVSGTPMEATIVLIVGTTTGAFSDKDGRFEISGVKAGWCTVRISAVHYITQERYKILVEPGKTTQLDIKLVEDKNPRTIIIY